MKTGKVSEYSSAEKEDWDFDPDQELAKTQAANPKIVSVSTEAVGGPRPGKPCGKKYETWKGKNNCCDFVEPMAWDDSISVEVLAPETRGIVGVTGGAPPYHWSVRGEGFALNEQGNLRDGFTDTPYVWIYALHNACGFAPIEVTDGCSIVNDRVRSTVGEWVPRMNSDGGVNLFSEINYDMGIADYVMETDTLIYAVQDSLATRYRQRIGITGSFGSRSVPPPCDGNRPQDWNQPTTECFWPTGDGRMHWRWDQYADSSPYAEYDCTQITALSTDPVCFARWRAKYYHPYIDIMDWRC
jgi:hypothetical protein